LTSFLEIEEEETDSIFEVEISPPKKTGLDIEQFVRRRLSSVSSIASRSTIGTNFMEVLEEEETSADAKRRSQTKETKVEGSVSWRLYAKYFFSGGGKLLFFVIYSLNLISQALFIIVDWWMKQWTNAADARIKSGNLSNYYFSNYANASAYELLPGLELDTFNSLYYAVYVGLVLAFIVVSQISIRNFLILCLRNVPKSPFHEADVFRQKSY
ncbi:Uncharacterized protein FKW44_000493, partial [Caligus rogercresseyi]